jgi:hypothetical protein
MAVNLSFIGGAGWQFFDNNGNVLSGGKLYTYEAGTTTPQTTFTSRSGAIANTNPIILDSAGRTPEQIWSTEGLLYKYVVADSDNIVLRTWDNIGGSVVASDLAQDLANSSSPIEGDALVGFRQSNSSGNLPGAVGRTVHDKLQEFVSVKDFGAVGDGIADDSISIITAYTTAKNIFWPAGTYRLTQYVRVYANTKTIFDNNVIIEKDYASDVIFSNADSGNTTTTAYNGDGDISFTGPVNFIRKANSAGSGLQPYAFVHAKGFVIDGEGGAVIQGWTGRHAIEINACAEWSVTGYTFKDQNASLGNEALSEVIQWDGAFDSARFPFAPGAADQTVCQDFEISNCFFEDIYTAYGAHHTDFGGAKHLRARLINNTILNAKNQAERLRHLKDSIAYGQMIQNSASTASNIRDCIGLTQDNYTIIDCAPGATVVFFQTSQNCIWGPSSRIRFSGSGTIYTTCFEVGSVANPSIDTVIYEGVVTPGSSVNSPIIADNATRTVFIGTSNANDRSRLLTWGLFYPSLNISPATAGSYILLAKVSEPSQSLAGSIYARRIQSVGSGSQSAVVTFSTIAGTDGARRTVWSQNYAIETNAVSIEEVTWTSERWVALKTSSTADRAFASGAAFVGFATTYTDRFRVVPAVEVSAASAITTGRQHFASDLLITGDGVLMPNLPITAPATPGSLWNDGGTVKIT